LVLTGRMIAGPLLLPAGSIGAQLVVYVGKQRGEKNLSTVTIRG